MHADLLASCFWALSLPQRTGRSALPTRLVPRPLSGAMDTYRRPASEASKSPPVVAQSTAHRQKHVADATGPLDGEAQACRRAAAGRHIAKAGGLGPSGGTGCIF